MLDQVDEDRWLTYAEAGELLGITAEAARVRARRYRWPRRTPNEHGAVARVLVPADVRRTDRPELTSTPGRPADDRGTDELGPAGQTASDLADMTRTIIETVEVLTVPIREQLDHERARADQAEQNAAEHVQGFEQSIKALTRQLTISNEHAAEDRARADQAERRADDEHARADREHDRALHAEQRADRERERADREGARIEEAEQRVEAAQKRVEAERAHVDEQRSRADRAEERAENERARAEQAEQRADDERGRADRAEERADDAQLVERAVRKEMAGLQAELEARRQWGLGRRLRWALGRK